MRVLYLIVDDLQPSPAELARLTDAGQALMPDGGTFAVTPIAFGPAGYYESAAGFALCAPGIMHAVRRHQSAHDAFIIGCFGDPGLRAARTVAHKPVIGGCEAAMAFSYQIAQRVGIVTVERSDIPEIAARLAELECAHRCVGIDAIQIPFDTLIDDPDLTLARLEQAARPLVDRGAQAILLGCMSFGFPTFDRPLQASLGVPVINPVSASIAAAYAAGIVGLGPSPRWVAPIVDDTVLEEHLAELEAARTRSATARER